MAARGNRPFLSIDILHPSLMASVTFRNLPLTAVFDQDTQKSVLSLDWALNSGIRAIHSVASGILTIPSINGVFSLQIGLPVVASLPTDLVLGRDWLQYCRESVSEPCFYLSSGVVDLRRPSIGNPFTLSLLLFVSIKIPQHTQHLLNPSPLIRTCQ